MQPNKELHKDYVLKAAATKDPEALVEKARLLIKGEDMEPDPKTAMDILTKLEQNQTHAVPGMYFLLGYLHEEGLGTPQDMALAYQFYIKGAEQDDAKSMNNLGPCTNAERAWPRTWRKPGSGMNRRRSWGMKTPAPMWSG